MQFVTIAAFLSIFLIGFTALFSIFTYYYPDLRTQAYKTGMTTANAINGKLCLLCLLNFRWYSNRIFSISFQVILLLLIAIVYTFVYAGDTKLIRKDFFNQRFVCFLVRSNRSSLNERFARTETCWIKFICISRFLIVSIDFH